MAELRKCPFCGGEANIVTYQGSKRIFYIECKGCKALMGNPRVMISAMEGKLYFENEAELIKAWNTRKPMEAKVAELENASVSVDGYCETEEMIPLAKAISIVRGKERKYCGNCKHQPEPLTTCDWLKSQTVVFKECPRWDGKE